ncbi:OsmC family protein [Sulfobacillus acidophilus TPY]|uniref:OsmC family protein n=1 Tax=Sulfobacillus acidophilus (strain ATCC 700253 / DSM 10332 / NAL) TaxID=679936 RepID=G8U0D3_SULAD|nr:OsmC family protein [Sulfobacillus acidophilus TPY]AEW06475.1 OsmC family protein [Sulfobacillus acidophilus DSM 10332]
MAKTTFTSTVEWTGTAVRSVAKIRSHEVVIDEPLGFGGQDQGPTPVELLLAGLGGCLNVLIAGLAPRYGVELTHLTTAVEGDLDPDGIREIDSAVRSGYLAIRYQIHVESRSPSSQVEALIRHAERVCPVKDTLKGVPVTVVTGSHA